MATNRKPTKQSPFLTPDKVKLSKTPVEEATEKILDLAETEYPAPTQKSKNKKLSH